MNFINNQRLAQLAGVNFDSEKIIKGPIVYSRTHTIVQQFDQLKRFGSCVLVTSFSDNCCTDTMVGKLPQNVRKWFSNNVTAKSQRVETVPIGIRTSPKGEVLLQNAISNGRLESRNLVYMNFWRQIPRQNNPRRGLYERFGKEPWITVEGGFEHVPMEQFYEGIASHPYVLSPAGAGPDCHRHWEALHLGSIPIVLRSEATRILDDLPCLQVNNWAEVTRRRLLDKLPGLEKKFNSPAMKIIWFEHWKERILNA